MFFILMLYTVACRLLIRYTEYRSSYVFSNSGGRTSESITDNFVSCHVNASSINEITHRTDE